MMTIEECYKTLGLNPGSSEDEIAHAYRDLLRIWNPLRFDNDPDLQRKVQKKLYEIDDAYDQITRSNVMTVPPKAASSGREEMASAGQFLSSPASGREDELQKKLLKKEDGKATKKADRENRDARIVSLIIGLVGAGWILSGTNYPAAVPALTAICVFLFLISFETVGKIIGTIFLVGIVLLVLGGLVSMVAAIPITVMILILCVIILFKK